MIKNTLLFFVCFLMFTPLAHADIGKTMCDALSDDKTYKDDKSYKKLIPGKDGWVFRTLTDMKDDFELNEISQRRFKRLHDAFASHGIELVITLLPTRGMMHSEHIEMDEASLEKAWESYISLSKQLESQGVHVATASRGAKDFYYKRDHHWRPDGARFIAQEVAKKVRALPAYEYISKTQYTTQEDGTAEQAGTFSKFINKACGSAIKGETVPSYKTVAANTDLFGDTPNADIVLVGTSNSTQSASKANFDGFLREYIGSDVENLSVSGGGMDTAFYNWLHSENYNEHKPKIVIWEVPVYQDFDNGPLFRQLIPAVYGECAGISTEDGTVSEKLTLFSDVWQEGGKSGNNLYALVSVEGEGIRKLRAVTEYEGGRKDIQGLRRSKRYTGGNVFFFEFNQNRPEAINSFSMSFPKSANGMKVSASLCEYPTPTE